MLLPVRALVNLPGPFRVFLRHCCAHLAGPDPAALPAYPAGVRAARKTLLAVAGLVTCP